MGYALAAAFLAAIGGAFFIFTAYPLVAIVFYFLALACCWGYVDGTYKFWHVNAEPKFKAFVFGLRGIGLFGGGVICSALPFFIARLDAYKSWSENQVASLTNPIVLASISMPFFLCGGYSLYVYDKINRTKRKRNNPKREQEALISKLTTGAFSNEKEIKQAGCHDRYGYFVGRFKNKAIFIPQPVHAITYGGPGSGKSIGTVIPNVLNWPGSLFVTDPKGDLGPMTAAHRRSLGQKVVFLNPWELHGMPNTPYNPFHILVDDVKISADPSVTGSALAKHRELEDAKVLAEILIPEPEKSDDNAWVRKGARLILRTFMLYLAHYNPQSCSLIGLRRLLVSESALFEAILDQLSASSALNGELKVLARDVIKSYIEEPEQFANCSSEARNALDPFANYGAMAKAVPAKARFDMQKLASKPTTIYLTLPGEFRDAYRAWMNMIVTIAIEVVGRRTEGSQPILFMLDEFANLGQLPRIDKALAEYRGAGFRGWLIVQNREQLKSVYKEDKASSIEDLCDIHQILSCSHEHSKRVSERLGQEAYVKTSGNTTNPFDRGYKDRDENWSVETRPLMEPGELTRLNDEQIVFSKGRLRWPMRLNKCRFWDIFPWSDQVQASPLEGPAPKVSRSQQIILEESTSYNEALNLASPGLRPSGTPGHTVHVKP
jgi:type IV secretion system protein VirD4